MMKLFFRQKLFWVGLGGTIIAVFIFTFAFMGSTVNPTPEGLPIAVVVQDEGMQLPNGSNMNFGELLKEKMNGIDNSSVKWSFLYNVDKATQEMNEKNYYATIVLPENFSRDVFSLLSENANQPQVTVFINEGMNMSGATISSQFTNGILTTFNQQIQDQLFTQVEQGPLQLTVDQAKALAQPIHIITEKVNPVGTNSANGNTPAFFTQILWLTTLISSMILYLLLKKLSNKTTFLSVSSQLIGGIIFVTTISGLILWITEGVLNVSIPNSGEMLMLMLFTGLSFFFIQNALLNWMGFIAAPLIILLFFFSMPILTMAPELLPNITQNWLYSWVPFRFSVEGFKDLLFFGKSSFEVGIGTLTWIGIGSLFFMYLSVVKPQKGEKEEKQIDGVEA
ncbi:YhgE/Pip domain-containing protein [Chengkuizengella sediminis]|uniref:YhgE/Pip domain-containing protein n=1 Tax=Chengkuizengella sediminis TaxID=1885917 RepID=UPI001389BC9C|nr:ABC transporter permease [Chengkuizengella sediminis]NDI36020.1 DUF3533 domain-containing protein [Chengkuizengella sediminis]